MDRKWLYCYMKTGRPGKTGQLVTLVLSHLTYMFIHYYLSFFQVLFLIQPEFIQER